MDDNPYSPPTTIEVRPRRVKRIHLSLENGVFLVLGAIFVGLGTFAVLNLQSATSVPTMVARMMTIGAIELAMMGGLLLMHCIARKQITIYLVALALFIFMVTLVLFALYSSFR